MLALDIDTRFLDLLSDGTLHVQQGDVTAHPLPAGQFDLVHARLLLEHLPGRDAVLRGLADALAPGGWLLVEDFDWATATVVDPPSAVQEQVARACLTLMQGHGYDPHYGRRLPGALRGAGLSDVGTHAAAAQVDADPLRGVPQWKLLVDQLAPTMLAAGLVTRADLRAYADRAPTPTCCTTATPSSSLRSW